MKKQYIIKGNAGGMIPKIWTDQYGEKIHFYCIFDTKEEAKKVLKVMGDAMWHIEEGLITEVVGSKKI